MKSIKEHVGFVVGDGYNERAAAAIKKIVAAEAAGIRQIWMNQGLEIFHEIGIETNVM